MKALPQTQLAIALGILYATISFPCTANLVQATTEQLKTEVSNTLPTFNETENSLVIPKIENVATEADAPNSINDNDNVETNTSTLTLAAKTLATSPTLFLAHVNKSDNQFIPVIQDAIIFANVDDELPAIVNYYTYVSQESIINFYQDAFGDVISQEIKRERLTLKFSNNEQLIRVIISAQNKKNQVDVIVTEKNATP